MPNELSAEIPPVGKEGVFATGGDSWPFLGTFESVSPNLCAPFFYRNGVGFFLMEQFSFNFVGEV